MCHEKLRDNMVACHVVLQETRGWLDFVDYAPPVNMVNTYTVTCNGICCHGQYHRSSVILSTAAASITSSSTWAQILGPWPTWYKTRWVMGGTWKVPHIIQNVGICQIMHKNIRVLVTLNYSENALKCRKAEVSVQHSYWKAVVFSFRLTFKIGPSLVLGVWCW